MAIAYVSSAIAEATSITMPSHSTGDWLIICAMQTDSDTPPSLPAGWTNIQSSANPNTSRNSSVRVGYKIATSGSETSDTWTNADMIIAHVYSGLWGFGAKKVTYGNSTAEDPIIGGLTPFNDSGSWVVGFVTSGNADAYVASAGSLTRRTDYGGSVDDGASYDTNGIVTSFTDTDVGNGSLGDWIAISIELLDHPPPAGDIFLVGGVVNGTEAETVTVGTHIPGDLILFWAFRDNADDVIPSLPGDCTSIATLTGTSCAARLGYKWADTESETSGTWTNATELWSAVYRGVAALGGSSTKTEAAPNASTNTVTLVAPPSWVVIVSATRSTTGAYEPQTANGNSVRGRLEGATNDGAWYDTRRGVTSYTGETITTTLGGSTAGITMAVELIPISQSYFAF